MKKISVMLLILAMLISLCSCSSANGGSTPVQNQPATSNSDNPDSQTNKPDEDAAPNEPDTPASNDSTQQAGKILVAYFSRVGNTQWEDGVDAVTSASLNVVDGDFAGNAQLLAQTAQQITGGDLFLIQTVDTYPSDYRETTNAAAEEQSNDTRPELAAHVDDMEQYDTIVLIYPNWWGTLPQPLVTFLEEYDFSGKTILPLCTHEGSAMGNSEQAISSLCPDAVLMDGLAVRGSAASSAQADVENWINASGILDRAVTAAAPAPEGDPIVYMTAEITPEGLMAVYEALNWTPGNRVAVHRRTARQQLSAAGIDR